MYCLTTGIQVHDDATKFQIHAPKLPLNSFELHYTIKAEQEYSYRPYNNREVAWTLFLP